MKAPKLYNFFETKQRGDTTIAVFRDGAPKWLRDAVEAAHRGSLPNDWIYEECRAACSAIDYGELSDSDDMHEYCDGRVDVYMSALWQWAADMRGTALFDEAEERASDTGDLSEDTDRRFAVLQYCAVEIIAQTILEAVEENEEWNTWTEVEYTPNVWSAFGHDSSSPRE